MAETAMATILIVEDDPKQLRLYSKALRGHRLNCVATGTVALKSVAESMPDLILLDHGPGAGERGSDFLPQLKEIAGQIPIIVISGPSNIGGQLQLRQSPRSTHYVLEKPVDLDELELTVKIALAERGGNS